MSYVILQEHLAANALYSVCTPVVVNHDDIVYIDVIPDLYFDLPSQALRFINMLNGGPIENNKEFDREIWAALSGLTNA